MTTSLHIETFYGTAPRIIEGLGIVASSWVVVVAGTGESAVRWANTWQRTVCAERVYERPFLFFFLARSFRTSEK